MQAAAAVLSSEPEGAMANRIATDAASRADVILLRADDLLTNLSRLKLEQDLWDA